MKNSELEHRLGIINNRFGCKLGLDWMAGRPRLGRADKPGCIGRFIGPRVTKAQMMFYLDAFEAGCEEMEQMDISNRDYPVTCKLCGKQTSGLTAHRHDGGYVGDDCCWDERLRTTE
jgi:hypothetical protein